MEIKRFITSEDTKDNFVGIRFIDSKPQVVFPHGYAIPEDEAECRKDTFRLLGVLRRFARNNEGGRLNDPAELTTTLPIQSYQYVILDFLQYGYYAEKEKVYISDLRGKINWKRTVQHEQVQIDHNNPVFLKYQVGKVKPNENNMLALIHRYCVWLSLSMFGWLYFGKDVVPEQPPLKLNRPLFLSVLKNALSQTFNDRKKRLFTAMMEIIEEKPEYLNFQNHSIGIYHFESVWEQLIDYVFGAGNVEKEEYFPRAQWYIIENGKYYQTSALRPDTIMLYDKKLFILDAKYYRYGVTESVNDLPSTASIQKQITYAEHASNLKDENNNPRFPDTNDIYNAFLLPYNCGDKSYEIRFVAVGQSKWKNESGHEPFNYEYVLGLLVDTRHLMTTYVQQNLSEITLLATKIEDSVRKAKDVMNKPES